MNIKSFLLSYLSKESYTPVQASALAEDFGLDGPRRLEFYELIEEMLEKEMIRMTRKGKIKVNRAYLKEGEDRNSFSHKTEKEKNEEKNWGGQAVAPMDLKEARLEQKELPPESKEVFSEPEKTSPEPEKAFAEPEALLSKEKNSGKSEQKTGRVQTNRKGFGFVLPDEQNGIDIYVSGPHLNGALNGDQVSYQIIRNGDQKTGRNPEGMVTEVLERNPHPLIGTFVRKGRDNFVVPDDPRYFADILIPQGGSMNAEENDKVLVEIVTYQPGDPYPRGHVREIIGKTGEGGVDITSIARTFEIPCEFSKEAQDQAQTIPQKLLPQDRKGRRDLRNLYTVTIDGADAKDFDDAISVEKRGKYYNLYVHIADVSHYVPEGGPIDRDAYQRGNSVYLLDRVIPMLPLTLSNGICSLNPNEERLTMTTQISLNDQGEMVDSQFYPSVIRSNHRLIYTDVSDYMEEGKKFSEDAALYPQLDLMKKIYQMLDEQRDKKGTLDFDFPETKIILNEDGQAVDVKQEERRIANRVIEEFMILNNVVIGTYFYKKQLPFIYRIHEKPTAESIDHLNQVLTAFHYPQVSTNPRPEDLDKILEMAQGKKEEKVIGMAVLQSLQRAVYSPRPEIHFGLAEEHYTHFTAPIRRYSDLIAHRLVKSFLKGQPRKEEGLFESLTEKCTHISDMEERAEEAERDVIDMKSAEYMQGFIGEEFDGIVSSLMNFGVFVSLENSIEGLAHFRDMSDDYYTYDEVHFVAKGERTHRQIHYGDRVKVLVTAASPENREINFKILWRDQPKEQNSKKNVHFGPAPSSHLLKTGEESYSAGRIETGYTGRRGSIHSRNRDEKKTNPRLRRSIGRKPRRPSRRRHR